MQPQELLKAIKSVIDKKPTEFEAYQDYFDTLRLLGKEDKAKSFEHNLWLRGETARHVMQGKDPSKIAKFYELNKKTYLYMAQDDFDSYCIYLEWNRPVEKRFYQHRAKALKPIVDGLQAMADGELDLLAVSMPPGTGKTGLAIFYLTWLAGKRPDLPILGGSHSNSFLQGVYEECLRTMQPGGEYLWNDVFPASHIVKTNAKDMKIDVDNARRFSTLQFSSIGSGNAGKVRAQSLLYCDDLCSGIEEALSQERMDNLWGKYSTDLKQRKEPSKIGECPELHIATRWSVHDVIGRLEREYAGSDRARFIVVPALDDKGNSNFDYGNGLGFTKKSYEDIHRTMDDASWRALYMNEPVEREGLLYHADDLRRFYELPAGEPDAVLAICDTAEGGGDDTFLPVFYQYGNDHYCVDCVCSDALPEITDGLCADILLRHKVKMCQFESNSAGGRTADKVQEIVKSKGGHTHITKKRTTANKATKIIVNSPYTKEHCLFYDNKMIKRGSPYASMMNKMCSYTVSGKSKHDDVVDGMAQYALFVQSLEGNVAVVQRRLF